MFNNIYQTLSLISEIDINKFQDGKTIKGLITFKNKDSMLVDIGFKSEGIIKSFEMKNFERFKVNNKIEVKIIKIEDEHGNLVISRSEIDENNFWDSLENILKNNIIIKGVILKQLNTGYIVDIWGINSFLPQSQTDFKVLEEDIENKIIGKEFEFKLIYIYKEESIIVVSKKDFKNLDNENELIKKYKEGNIIYGIIKYYTEYGVFVDLGGIDGLIYITDLIWGKINNIRNVVKFGKIIKARIININNDTNKILLGLKHFVGDPWMNIDKIIPQITELFGFISNISNIGILIQLKKGIEGLIYKTNIGDIEEFKKKWNLKNKDKIKVSISSIDYENRKISLNIKDLENINLYKFFDMYSFGNSIYGLIASITNLGIKIYLGWKIWGIIIIEIELAKKFFNKWNGYKIKVFILDLDLISGIIKLGIKYKKNQIIEEISNNYNDEFYNDTYLETISEDEEKEFEAFNKFNEKYEKFYEDEKDYNEINNFKNENYKKEIYIK